MCGQGMVRLPRRLPVPGGVLGNGVAGTESVEGRREGTAPPGETLRRGGGHAPRGGVATPKRG